MFFSVDEPLMSLAESNRVVCFVEHSTSVVVWVG